MSDTLPDEAEVDKQIEEWWAEHARMGPFGYWRLARVMVESGHMPELWFPEAEPPWDVATKREWLRRANEFMAKLRTPSSPTS